MSPFQAAFREFLESQPLYAKASLELPEYFGQMDTDTIEMPCTVCGVSRPHRDPRPRGSGAGMGGPPKLQDSIVSLFYQCTGCRSGSHQFWVEIRKSDGWMMKVGQRPAWSIRVPNQLERELGATASVYKRGLVCLSQGYGLAACAYMRRALEDHINPLLDLLLQEDNSERSPEEEQEIQDIRRGKAFDKKLELAYRMAPSSLVVNGINPLKLIHDQLSVGVHHLTEEECVTAARQIGSALAYTISELNRQHDAKMAFVKDVKHIGQQTRSRP